MSGLTNYLVPGGLDLSYIFQPLPVLGAQAPATNYKITGGADLSTLFKPYGGGLRALTTGYKVSNGNYALNTDLSFIFNPFSSYDGVWPSVNLNNANNRQSIYNGTPPFNNSSTPTGGNTYSFGILSTQGYGYYNKLILGPTNIVYVTMFGIIYAISADLITLLFTYTTSPLFLNLRPPVLGVDNIIYISTSSGITALNSLTGSLVWNFPVVLSNPNSPIINGSSIYVSTSNGYIYTNSLTSGSLKWQLLLPTADPVSNLAIDIPGIIYAAAGVYLYAILDSGSSGSILWTTPAFPYSLSNSTLSNAPNISNDGSTIYIATNSLAPINAYIYAINSADGLLKWSFLLSGVNLGTRYTFPAVDPLNYLVMSVGSNNALYVNSPERVYSITDSGTSGTLSWSLKPLNANNITAPSIGLNGTIYISGDFEILVSITGGGVFNWWYQASSIVAGYSSPASIGSNGKVYYSTTGSSLNTYIVSI